LIHLGVKDGGFWAAMLTQENQVEIRVLARQGKGIRAIARELEVSRNTVRRVLRGQAPRRYGPRKPRATKLDSYKPYVCARVQAAGELRLPAPVLLREIREQGYAGSLTQLKVYLAAIRPAKKEEPLVRFETEPGQQMQVDFVVFKRCGVRLPAFVATLGYSRMSFVRFVHDETWPTVRMCLEAAFAYFGGVPREVLFDNMKTVVQERNAYGRGQHRLHPGLLALSRDLGFAVRLCRPYRAKTKGKVERFNRYLRGSFYNPLVTRLQADGALDVDTANVEVLRWLRDVANVREHQSTGARPVDRLEVDQKAMLPYEPAMAPIEAAARVRLRTPLPVESLQHPLSVYGELLTMPEVRA
jgi:transposase